MKKALRKKAKTGWVVGLLPLFLTGCHTSQVGHKWELLRIMRITELLTLSHILIVICIFFIFATHELVSHRYSITCLSYLK